MHSANSDANCFIHHRRAFPVMVFVVLCCNDPEVTCRLTGEAVFHRKFIAMTGRRNGSVSVFLPLRMQHASVEQLKQFLEAYLEDPMTDLGIWPWLRQDPAEDDESYSSDDGG